MSWIPTLLNPSEIIFRKEDRYFFGTRDQEPSVCLRTCEGKGSGLFIVPERMFDRVIEEFKAYDPYTYEPPERTQEFVPGPRGGTGPNSLAYWANVYAEEDHIVTFGHFDGFYIRFHPWWGRGQKNQVVRFEQWKLFIQAVEERFNS